MRPPRSQNDPLLSLVGWVVFGLVVEIQCPSDYFGIGDIKGFSLLPHPIKGVLRQANRKGRVFDVHRPLLHDSQMVWSSPTSSENSVASSSDILHQIVVAVMMVTADGRLCNLAEASEPMCLLHAIRPFRSDQNVSVTAVSIIWSPM
jgi:hypothetical protein